MSSGRLGAVRPPDQPLAWAGSDRILLDDVTSLGLHRKVIARKDDIPHQVNWLQQAYAEARHARVDWWLVQRSNGFWYLWIVWKDG